MTGTVTPKPSRGAAKPEADIDRFIGAGGSAGPDRQGGTSGADPDRTRKVTVRVPEDVLGQVDGAIEERRRESRVHVYRNSWILEAVVEKLRRERVNGPFGDAAKP